MRGDFLLSPAASPPAPHERLAIIILEIGSLVNRLRLTFGHKCLQERDGIIEANHSWEAICSVTRTIDPRTWLCGQRHEGSDLKYLG